MLHYHTISSSRIYCTLSSKLMLHRIPSTVGVIEFHPVFSVFGAIHVCGAMQCVQYVTVCFISNLFTPKGLLDMHH